METITHSPSAHEDAPAYRSAFRSWDTRAWIRTKPHRTAVPFERGLLFFSPEALPGDGDGDGDANDTTLAERCIRHLQAHLAMTVPLELGPVNDACLVLRDSSLSQWLPRQLKDDALRVYADEAGHAEMTNEMARAVECATGIAPPTTTPPFVRCVSELVAAADAAEPGQRDLVRFLGGVVSETLISVTLTRVPLDDRVQLAVRQLLADHADDERRHAALFRDAFSYVWPRLAPDVRRAATLLVPQMVLAFLQLERADVAAAVAEPTLRLFRDAGTPVLLTVSA